MEEVQHCRIRNDGISLVPQLSMSTKKVCPLIGGRAHICSTTNILIKITREPEKYPWSTENRRTNNSKMG